MNKEKYIKKGKENRYKIDIKSTQNRHEMYI